MLPAPEILRAMSQRNVEVVRSFILLDLDESMKLVDPAVFWNPAPQPAARGLDATRASIERWEADWEEYEEVPEDFAAIDDRVVVTVRFRGLGSQSGVEVHTRMYEVFTLREGLIVRMDEFTERAEALEAAGLSE